MLRSHLCDYSGAYIVVKGTITIVRPNGAKRNKEIAFKNNGPFKNSEESTFNFSQKSVTII